MLEGGGEGGAGGGRGEVVMVKRLIIALQLSRIRILVGGGGKIFNRVGVSLRRSGQTVNKMSGVPQRADGRTYGLTAARGQKVAGDGVTTR